ncbi:MAG: hypothetical protein KHW52_08250 [Clostridium sp.]|jgi:hypothetical protein|nr:hypothetical protein [Clostridium sp.]
MNIENEDSKEKFYSESNIKAIKESIKQLEEGKVVKKSLKKLEQMSDK